MCICVLKKGWWTERCFCGSDTNRLAPHIFSHPQSNPPCADGPPPPGAAPSTAMSSVSTSSAALPFLPLWCSLGVGDAAPLLLPPPAYLLQSKPPGLPPGAPPCEGEDLLPPLLPLLLPPPAYLLRWEDMNVWTCM